MRDFSRKQLIIFDLDETLTPSKTPMDKEMAVFFGKLLQIKNIAVISGGLYEQMTRQLVAPLAEYKAHFKRLSLFPTCGASFYCNDGNGWKRVYENIFTDDESRKIKDAFADALQEAGFSEPKIVYGNLIEDRKTQITFSAFGQDAPLEIKQGWDPDLIKRKEIIEKLAQFIPEFEIRAGGATSIDVTKKGIDKAYGVLQMEAYLGTPREKMLFIGDRLHPGGNDYPVKELGIDCMHVAGPHETKIFLKSVL